MTEPRTNPELNGPEAFPGEKDVCDACHVVFISEAREAHEKLCPPKALGGGDWVHVFSFANAQSVGNSSAPAAPSWVTTGEAAEVFDIGDVAELYGVYETPQSGSYQDSDFSAYGKLKDGRFFFIEAGCDTTGWGCQDGGHSIVASSLDELTQLGMSADERARFAVPAEDPTDG